MEKKQTNYQIYEQMDILLKKKKLWSKDWFSLIERMEPEPDYPVDDPRIIQLIKFGTNEIFGLDPAISKKVDIINHILEVKFETFDSFHYDLLATYLYDLTDHLKGLLQPHPPEDELKKAKIKAIARLLESLAAICANNAQIM